MKLKILELKNEHYIKRFIVSLFPSESSIILYVIFGFLYMPLFKFDYSNISYWFVTAIFMLPWVYFLIIRPYKESKVYITAIELDANKSELYINYLLFNRKKYTSIRIKDLRYNVFNQVKTSMADRIIFFDKEKELLKQYSNSNWMLEKIKKSNSTQT